MSRTARGSDGLDGEEREREREQNRAEQSARHERWYPARESGSDERPRHQTDAERDRDRPVDVAQCPVRRDRRDRERAHDEQARTGRFARGQTERDDEEGDEQEA